MIILLLIYEKAGQDELYLNQKLAYEREIQMLRDEVLRLSKIPKPDIEPLPIIERHTHEIVESRFGKMEDVISPQPTPIKKETDMSKWEAKQAADLLAYKESMEGEINNLRKKLHKRKNSVKVDIPSPPAVKEALVEIDGTLIIKRRNHLIKMKN